MLGRITPFGAHGGAQGGVRGGGVPEAKAAQEGSAPRCHFAYPLYRRPEEEEGKGGAALTYGEVRSAGLVDRDELRDAWTEGRRERGEKKAVEGG